MARQISLGLKIWIYNRFHVLSFTHTHELHHSECFLCRKCVSAVQTLGNLSLYTWFIITISWSKEIGERPGLKQQNRHMNTGEVWPKLDFLLYGDKTAFMSLWRVEFISPKETDATTLKQHQTWTSGSNKNVKVTKMFNLFPKVGNISWSKQRW